MHHGSTPSTSTNVMDLDITIPELDCDECCESSSPTSICSTDSDGKPCFCSTEPRPHDHYHVRAQFKSRDKITGLKVFAEQWIQQLGTQAGTLTWRQLRHRWRCELTAEERERWNALAEEIREDEWSQPLRRSERLSRWKESLIDQGLLSCTKPLVLDDI